MTPKQSTHYFYNITLLMMIPLILLYEMSVAISRVMVRRGAPRARHATRWARFAWPILRTANRSSAEHFRDPGADRQEVRIRHIM
jgi:hypothetical protein